MPDGNDAGDVIVTGVQLTVSVVTAGSGAPGGVVQAPINLLAVNVYFPGVVYVWVVTRVQLAVVQIGNACHGDPSPKFTSMVQFGIVTKTEYDDIIVTVTG